MVRRRIARTLLTVLLFIVPAAAIAQEGTPIGDYLGQDPPGSIPVPFAVDVLPAGAFAGTFAPDLTEFYYNTPGFGGRAEIAGLRLIEGTWTPIDFVVPYAFEPHISPTGDRMFYVIEDGGMGQGYVSVREGSGWSEPQHLPGTVNGTYHFPMYFTSTLDGTLFWTKLSNDASLVSAPFADGTFSPARKLGFSLNYRGGCAHPGVAPDGSYVLFDMESNGQSDLYVSFATATGGWAQAVRIDTLSEPDADEMAPSVSPDGKIIFFNRMSTPAGIYWVDAGVLDEYRP